MFGHNDDQPQPTASTGNTGAMDISDGATSSTPAIPSPDPVAPAASNPIQAWQHPGAPIGSEDPSPPIGASNDNPSIGGQTEASSHELIDLKQKALSQLSPIVGQLDQAPEEKFRTLMMMIQASDDQSMLKEAYDTAQKITDEKTKAQALLDVVNEINYFTQHKN